MKAVVTESPKQPYTKPMLTKHKSLRDITAGGTTSIPST
jgi:hypothetical protein